MTDFSKIQTILWDIDGTLLDFAASEAFCIKKCAANQGYRVSDEQVQVYKGINKSYWEALERGEVTKDYLYLARFRDWFQQMGIDDIDAVRMNDDYQVALGEYPVLREDTLTVLKVLKDAGYKQYAVTNGSNVAQSGKLYASGVGVYFDDIYISEKIGIPKPRKEYFDYVQAQTGYEQETTVIIGDSLTSDICGGNNAGIKTIWFRLPDADDNTKYSVDAEVRTLTEILGLLGVSAR